MSDVVKKIVACPKCGNRMEPQSPQIFLPGEKVRCSCCFDVWTPIPVIDGQRDAGLDDGANQ